MGDGHGAEGRAAGRLTITGLGPGSLERLPAPSRALLEDPDVTVVVRTIHHPAARQLASIRPLTTCDDLYESSERFSEVYEAIADRVLDQAAGGPTVYAVPGSPLVGEFAVRRILARSPDAQVVPAESFLDAVLARVGYDPLDRGLRLVNGHELPDPLVIDAPTVIVHVDRPETLAEAAAALSRVLPEGATVTVCVEVGGADEQVVEVPVDAVPAELAGLRTSLFVDAEPAGLFGLVGVMRRLRAECPWDRQQTHQTLVRHLMEETYELVDAIARLPDGEVDFVAYSAVEEELGDVLLQVLFHAAIAAESRAFGIDDVATRLREKLVRRHPHVFGDVEVADADEVTRNWETIKQAEREGNGPGSLLDGIPTGLPALERAETVQRKVAGVGFDWSKPAEVVPVLRAEVQELEAAVDEDVAAAVDEAGDVIFTAVNLLRHLGASSEVALRRAVDRFERRFRAVEEEGPLDGVGPEELEARWQRAKRASG